MKTLRTLLLAEAPLLLPLLGLLILRGACQDDWCHGPQWEPLLMTLGAAAVVGLICAWLLERGLSPWRSALAAWSSTLALLCILIATSQALERDVMPAMTATWTAFALLATAFVLARPRPAPAGAPRKPST